MTTSTLLAAGTTAVTSSDFTVAAGQPARVAMTATSTNARMTVHSVVLGVESLYAALSQSDPGITISAPGTYRVKRPVLTVASGVEVSTLVKNHVEAEVGALTGATAGIVDPVGGGPVPWGNVAYTWATRPAAAGNTGQVIRISDVGTGLGGSHWVSDGTYWRPVGGSVVIAQQSGSIATPVSSFTGVTSSQFTPIKQPVIPAGMLIPGQSSIEVEVACRRTGANATALLNVRLGTAKTSADNTAYSFTYAATTLLDILATPSIFVAETGRITGTNWQSRGGSGNASVFNDRTGNINTAAEMGFTFDISSANASDSFALIGYKVRLVS